MRSTAARARQLESRSGARRRAFLGIVGIVGIILVVLVTHGERRGIRRRQRDGPRWCFCCRLLLLLLRKGIVAETPCSWPSCWCSGTA